MQVPKHAVLKITTEKSWFGAELVTLAVFLKKRTNYNDRSQRIVMG